MSIKNCNLTATIRQATASEWDLIWRECPSSTYFHSREWAEIWATATDNIIPSPFLISFSDGKQALLPFSQTNRAGIIPLLTGTNRLYISSPECTYGGWISRDMLDSDHVSIISEIVIKRFANLICRLNPYDEPAHKSKLSISEEGETHAINLKKGFDTFVSNMSKGHRTAVRQAIRSGVSIRIASSIKDWQDYYRVYEDSVERWGSRILAPKYSWKLFQEMYNRRSNNIELWLSLHKNKVISGALCFHSTSHFVYWHGASLQEYFGLRPVNLLLYEIIKNVVDRDFTWFDFNPSGGLEGVRAFKERFGAQTLSCPIVKLTAHNIRKRAFEKLSYMYCSFIKYKTGLN